MNARAMSIDHHPGVEDELCAPHVFTFGHVRQLDAVGSRFVAGLARQAPIISSGEPVTYLDIDDTIRATFGYAKQGASYGYSGVKDLNALWRRCRARRRRR
jgi:hypothetical protein